MSHCVFIKSYLNDLDWLFYCVKSILKFYDFEELVIVLEENCRGVYETDWNTAHLKIKYVPTCPHPKGYLQQQLEKLKAFQHTDAEYILYVDSDTVFTCLTTIYDFLCHSRPIVYKTPYSQVGEAICWKKPTQDILERLHIEYEYMRRFPIVYRRSTIMAFFNQYERKIQSYIDSLTHFSEFNLLGAFAEIYEEDRYEFIDTSVYTLLPEPRAKQFWSWGELTDSIRTELESITT